MESRRVAKIIRACQELPGQHLFEYRDESADVHKVGSADVNAYLREIAGKDVTAKDFRTWTGTMEAALALRDFVVRGDKPAKAHVHVALERAAGRLGNTVAICRKCYVHPEIIASYESGEFLLDLPEGMRRSRARFALSAEERAVLAFLKTRTRTKR